MSPGMMMKYIWYRQNPIGLLVFALLTILFSLMFFSVGNLQNSLLSDGAANWPDELLLYSFNASVGSAIDQSQIIFLVFFGLAVGFDYRQSLSSRFVINGHPRISLLSLWLGYLLFYALTSLVLVVATIGVATMVQTPELSGRFMGYLFTGEVIWRGLLSNLLWGCLVLLVTVVSRSSVLGSLSAILLSLLFQMTGLFFLIKNWEHLAKYLPNNLISSLTGFNPLDTQQMIVLVAVILVSLGVPAWLISKRNFM